MSDKNEVLSKEDDLRYQLKTLASYEAVDLDYPIMSVMYENQDGAEFEVDVCLVELAQRAVQLIESLDNQLAKLQ